MNGSVEERLREALGQRAEATRVASDAWPAIRARADRRPAFPRWTVLVPAVAVVLVVVVLAAGVDRGDRTVRVTGKTGRLYLVPTGVEPRFTLRDINNGPDVSRRPAWTYRVFGRPTADGATLAASVVVVVPADRAVDGSTPEPEPLRVHGRDVAVAGDDFGQRILSWTQADGRTIGVMTFGLSQTELVALAESLLPADATVAAPSLPPGFTAIGTGAVSDEVPLRSLQVWEAKDGDRFNVSIVESKEDTAGELAWWLPGGRAIEVRGKNGVSLARAKVLLAWRERPGTTVVLEGQGLTERELLEIAEGLHPVDDDGWRELSARSAPRVSSAVPSHTGPGAPPSGLQEQPQIGPPPGVLPDPNSYFIGLAVRGRSAPPCAAVGGTAVLPQWYEGQQVACYHVTPRRFLDAGDVATAEARPSGATGEWEVAFTLTPDGAGRFRALFDEVGPGGQFAVLLDGQIVSAPAFADRPPGDTGVVTGLDEQAARRLADRLGR